MWVGIDFGTTNSCAALALGNPPAPIPVKEPTGLGYSFPSSVFVDEEGRVFLGQYAEHVRTRDPSRYLRAFKLDLGTDTPYAFGKYEYLPEQLIAAFLQMLKSKAEEMANSSLDAAIVTIPATYDQDQRNRMRKAAEQAGFSKVELLVEPIAAAIYYDRIDDMRHKMKEGDLLLVYDLGGGTFDASLIRKQRLSYEVLAVSMGKKVGGEDFDKAIYNDLLKRCSPDFRNMLFNRSKDTQSQKATFRLQQDVLKSCRTLKHNISAVEEASEAYTVIVGGALKTESHHLTRQQFTAMIAGWIDETMRICQELIQTAGLTTEQVQRIRVLMVGGSCRIPYVRESLKQAFGKDRVFQAHEPELAVCMGAALYGDALERADSFLAEVDALCRSAQFRKVLQDDLPEFFQRLSTSLAEQIRKYVIVPTLKSWRDKEKELYTINDMEQHMKEATASWIKRDEAQKAIRAICNTWIERQLPRFAPLSDPVCKKYGVPEDILRLPNTIPLFQAEGASSAQFSDLDLDMKILSRGIIATISLIVITTVGSFLLADAGPIGLLVGLVMAAVVLVGTRLSITRERIKEIDLPKWLRIASLSDKKIDKEAEKMQPKLVELINNALQKDTLLSEKFVATAQKALHEAMRTQAKQNARYVWLHSEEDVA